MDKLRYIVCVAVIAASIVGVYADGEVDDVYYWPGQTVASRHAEKTVQPSNTDEKFVNKSDTSAVTVQYVSVQDTVVKAVIRR